MKKFAFYMLMLVVASALNAATYYVDPNGSDSNSCTITSPCRLPQRGLDVAQAGDTVQLAAGCYAGGLKSVRNGPVTVTGPSSAYVYAGDPNTGTMAYINHPDHTLTGFTMNGMPCIPQCCTETCSNYGIAGCSGAYNNTIRDYGIVGLSAADSLDIDNVTIDMLRYDAVVLLNGADNCTIGNLSHHDSGLGYMEDPNRAPGFSLYIDSDYNYVHHSTLSYSTRGLHVSGDHNYFDAMTVHHIHDGYGNTPSPHPGAVYLGGAENTFTYSTVRDNVRKGILAYGPADIYGNTIYNNSYAGISFEGPDNNSVCGNDLHDNNPDEGGDFEEYFLPEASCGGGGGCANCNHCVCNQEN